MWEHYRRTLIPMQLFILAMCAAALFAARFPWPVVALMFVIMQVGALLGAWWAANLRRRMQGRKDKLPLDGRLK